MKYNIIGDIHGRCTWEDLVDPSAINVFVGDYFDPYDLYTFEELESNFLNIIQFAKTNPGTVLLMGNHDMHYIYGAESTRFDYEHAQQIRGLLLAHISLFTGIAYSIDNQILITHAGVSSGWLDCIDYKGDRQPDPLSVYINSIFWDGYQEGGGVNGWGEFPRQYQMKTLTFKHNEAYWDCYGDVETHSPIWIRPNSLVNHNALENYVQVVGHTQFVGVHKQDNVYFIDCLGQSPQCLIYDSESKQFEIKKLNKK